MHNDKILVNIYKKEDLEIWVCPEHGHTPAVVAKLKADGWRFVRQHFASSRFRKRIAYGTRVFFDSIDGDGFGTVIGNDGNTYVIDPETPNPNYVGMFQQEGGDDIYEAEFIELGKYAMIDKTPYAHHPYRNFARLRRYEMEKVLMAARFGDYTELIATDVDAAVKMATEESGGVPCRFVKATQPKTNSELIYTLDSPELGANGVTFELSIQVADYKTICFISRKQIKGEGMVYER